MNRAFVVGIADYGRIKQPLPGCANDLSEWKALLVEQLHLPPSAVRSLADADASREGIIDGLNWLTAESQAGDNRIFAFAGHGARRRRIDAATGTLRADLEETLVAHPGNTVSDEQFMIFDEDLAALLDASAFHPDARLTLILDSCHSGGLLRDIVIGGNDNYDGPLPRCLASDVEEIQAEALARAFSEPEITRFGSLRSLTVEVPRVIFAAARAEQSAWDDRMDDGQRHGVFSFHAVRTLRAKPASTFEEVLSAVTPSIVAKFPQIPMLLGDSTRFSTQLL